jgi:hypothetical protein
LLRYFRINDPYRLVGLLILLLAIYLPLFINTPGITVPELKNMVIGEKLNEGWRMYAELVDSSAPLGSWFYEVCDSVFGRSLLGRHIVAFLLIFLQGAYLGIMLITRKVFNENTYIPSFLFCLLFFFSFDTLALSAELVGSTFLLFALNNLFKEIEFRVQHDETVFNLGLFISLASLFSFGFIIYLFCVMVALIFFTRSTPRKFLLLLFGFLLPHLLTITIAYLSNSLPHMWQYYYLANLGIDRDTFISVKGLLVLGAIPLTYFVISVVMLQREARFSKYQSQVLQIMFLWIGFSLLYVLYCKNLRPQNMIVFIPALAFLFTHFFLFIRRKKFIEMNAWILVIGVITMSYLARYNKFESVRYEHLLVTNIPVLENKKLLVLEKDISWFSQNRLATPYLNWSLSEEVFTHPEFYEHITAVYHAFKNDPPDVILDRNNLLKPFLDRMPEIKRQYVRKGEFYTRQTSN